MARHRRIDMRMHADEKYRRLTPCPPCGQALWWNLLAGKQTGIIPGLCTIGEAAFAEQLRWPLEGLPKGLAKGLPKGFREAWEEVTREGMAEADWESHLVWVPNAIKYNPPANPNVIRSWADAWSELPECALKLKAYEHLKGFLKGLGKGFGEAFEEVCRNPLPNPSPNQEAGSRRQEAGTREPPNPPKTGGGSTEDASITIPAELNTEEFRCAWGEWKDERAAKRRSYTPRGEREALKKLAPFGPTEAIRAIRESIAQGWQGLFPKTAEQTKPRGGFQTPGERVLLNLQDSLRDED